MNLLIEWSQYCRRASQVALVVKNPPASAGDVRDMGSIPGSGRGPGGWHGSTLQYSCPWTREPGGLQSTGLKGLDVKECTHTQYCRNVIALHINQIYCIIPIKITIENF